MEKKLFFRIGLIVLFSFGIVGCMSMSVDNDPYIWLEDVNSEKSLSWIKVRNQSSLEKLRTSPRFEKTREESLEILAASDKIPMISFHKNYVYNFWTDKKNQRGLYRRTTYADYKTANPKWEVVLDIDKLGKDEGKSWVFHGCSMLKPGSDYCMMILSDGGKDAEEIREFDLKTKTFVKDGFFIPLAKSWFTWIDKDNILLSTDYGKGTLTESEYPREVRLLKRGQSISQAEKIYEVGQQDMRAYSYSECDAEDCKTFIVRDKSFYRNEMYEYRGPGNLVRIDIPDSAQMRGYFQKKYYFYLTEDWKNFKAGMLLRSTFGDWDKSEIVYSPTSSSSFEEVAFSKTDIYLTIIEDVNRKVYRLSNNLEMVPFPSPSIGNTHVAATDIYSDRALFTFENPVMVTALYEWNGKLKKIKSMSPRFDEKNLVMEQFFASSFDGEKIPYFVVRDKTKTGVQPTLMTAYGGFQAAMYPYYEAVMGKLWLNQGGQFVIANIRGGGEYGPRWHEAALKQNRQVAYNDLFAVTEDLIKRGFTTSNKLALSGRSNGGLLAGVALTQRPDLFKAIAIGVPLLDMIRFHKLPAGASWIGEYGDPEIPKERDYILKYSPYQNLKTDKKYPAIFIYTSTFDDRVHPGHARKFAARLEEYKIPFYYYENPEGGHASTADSNQKAHFYALYYSFLYNELMR